MSWIPRSQVATDECIKLHHHQVFSHPLKISNAYTTFGPSSLSEAAKSASKRDNLSAAFVDPFGVNLEDKGKSNTTTNGTVVLDPLSQLALENANISVKDDRSNSELSNGDYKRAQVIDGGESSWAGRRQAILDRFTTNEKLSIVTSFIPGGTVMQSHIAVGDKTKHRLEQLDQFEAGSVRQMADLTQSEFVFKVNELSNALTNAWDADQRVNSIKIAIQCAKMLGNVTQAIRFYPSKFVLITDIFDTFGHLVYTRLFQKAISEVKSLSKENNAEFLGFTSISSETVAESTKETCRNWFYKVASIRELIPRIFLEAAILKSLIFVNTDAYDDALCRLVDLCRGIADPLVASYTRCYICRIGVTLPTESCSYISQAIEDTIKISGAMLGQSSRLKSFLSNQRITTASYCDLFQPAVDYMVHCLGHAIDGYRSVENIIAVFFTQFKVQTGIRNHGNDVGRQPLANGNDARLVGSSSTIESSTSPLLSVLLNSLIKNCDGIFLANNCEQFLNLIDQTITSESENFAEDKAARGGGGVGLTKTELLKTLGRRLLDQEPAGDKLRILNLAWSHLMRISQPSQYISCGEVWLQFACKYFGELEIDALLGDLVHNLSPDKHLEAHHQSLLNVVEAIVESCRDFSGIFGRMQNFVALLDLFQRESARLTVSRMIVDAFTRLKISQCSDLIVAGHLLALAKCIHDNMNAMTIEDETRSTAQLLCKLIDRFNFKPDFQQQLSFYVDARGSFSNVDAVMAHLVRKVNQLASDVHKIRSGRHNRKTAGFVRACSAYAYITIPSIFECGTRLALYIESAEVALQNQCLPQSDALLKSAIALIVDIPVGERVGTLQSNHNSVTSKSGLAAKELLVVDATRRLLSILLVVPDNPQQQNGVLYLFRGLLNAVVKYPWPEAHLENKVRLLINALMWLSVSSRSELPYHIDGVESNDKLYGQDKKFLVEIVTVSSTILDLILAAIKQFGSDNDVVRQATLSIELLECMVDFADLLDVRVQQLGKNLWTLVRKTSGVNESDHRLKLFAENLALRADASAGYYGVFLDCLKKKSSN